VVPLLSEGTLSLLQAAKLLPPGRRGKPVTLSCVLRWVLQGVKGPGGTIIRLEAARLGGRWITSREALERFSQALTPSFGDEPKATPRTPGRRARSSQKAAEKLEKLGI
jgi:hypothetical protein